MKDKIADALLKVALGFQVAEVTEEYAEVDGALKLTKRKRTKKDVPPDLKAVQMLLGENGGGMENMSDEELEAEKQRLLAALHAAEKKQADEPSLLKNKEKTATAVAKKPRAKPRKKVVRKKEDTK